MINEKKLDKEIVAFCKSKIDGGYYKMDTVDACVEIRHIIEEQPRVGKWIPCSERLPEEYGNYLVTSDEDVDIGTFNPDTAKWSCCDAEGFHWAYDIIAWMPLPEPYKEVSDE